MNRRTLKGGRFTKITVETYTCHIPAELNPVIFPYGADQRDWIWQWLTWLKLEAHVCGRITLLWFEWRRKKQMPFLTYPPCASGVAFRQK